MENNRKLILLVLVFVVLMAGAGVLYKKLAGNAENLGGGLAAVQSEEESGDKAEDEKKQVTAPDFKVYDKDGNAYSLADFGGKPIVLNFWASWCGPCRSEMPDFEEVYNKYKDRVNFVMVNSTDGSRETVKSASEFVEEKGYTFPVYYDTDFNATAAYGATALPTTFVIDAEGFVFGYNPGALDGEVLAAALDKVLTK